MATITGNVLFNTNNGSPTTGTGIDNVPIAFRNTTTGKGMICITALGGAFGFINVPAGNYTIVEAWGSTGGVAYPADFTNATTMTLPTPSDPPLSAMPSQPTNANAVQSLSPNTINITVSSANIGGQNFIDGPISVKVINVTDTVLSGTNLITAADNGTWGSLAAGTAINQSPSSEPYTGVVPGFTYIQATSGEPNDGRYSVTNISTRNTFGLWWSMADATTKDETGRYMMVNGASPGSYFFKQTINVTPYSYYYMSMWMANLINTSGYNLPQAIAQMVDSSNNVIYSQNLPSLAPINIPQWNQVSTVLTVGNNTQVTFRLVSNGAAGNGNDYAIDDIFLTQATFNDIISTSQTVDRGYADVGDTINYTVVLQNIGQSSVSNVIISNTIPNGTTFNTGSVKVNGTTFGAFNPTPPGFTLTNPTIIGLGQLVTITYNLNVATIPLQNPVVNSALATYNFFPIAGGATVTKSSLTNNVSTTVSAATISAIKQRLAYVTLGSVITYTIPVQNYGTTLANNVILIDTIPSGTTFVDNSVAINGVTINGLNPAPPTGISLGTIESGTISTLSFKVLVTTIPANNSIPNSTFITYNYVANPTIPLVKGGIYNSNIATSQFSFATLSSTKIVNTVFANLGDILTYTIAITNSGNVSANNIVFIDTIPNGTSIVGGSFKQDTTTISGSPNYPGMTLPNIIGIGKTTSVTFKVTVNSIPSPNPITNSANIAYTYTFNPSIANSGSGVTNTNTVNTQVNHATFEGITKYVDKIFSYMGDTITYTIVAPNSGNITAVNVIFRDTIPNGTTFITNSVTTNGIIMNGVSPVSGITLPDISPGGVGTITFQVLVG